MLIKKIFAVERGKLVQLKIIAAIFMAATLTTGISTAIPQNDGHPLIKPFEGSYIESQEVKELDEQKLVIGKVQEDRTVKSEKIEGKVTRVDYRDQDNRSSLERMRYYEKTLKGAGFEIIYSCSKEECGPDLYIETIGYYPPERYLTAFLKREEGNVWIALLVDSGPWTKMRIVEEKQTKADPVKVTAKSVTAPRKLNPQEWSNKTVKLGEGVFFKLNNYIAVTSFRNHPGTKHLFDSNFRNNFLTQEAEYTEEVEEAEDRVIVTRTLVMKMKDPCAPGVEAGGFSFCFKPKTDKPAKDKSKKYPDNVRVDQSQMLLDLKDSFDEGTKKYLGGVRAKIEKRLKDNPNDPEALQVKDYVNMNDAELLDQLLNKADSAKTKKIIHTSVVPYVAYEFRKVPEVDLFDLSTPLPKTNQFFFKPTRDQPVISNIPDVSNALKFPAMPSITSFSPERGKNEDTITISGANLDSVTSVIFFDDSGELPLTVVNRSPQQIEAAVYGWAGPKKVRLGWAGGTVESTQNFLIYFEPMKGIPPARGNGSNGEYIFDNTKTINARYITGFTFGKRFGDSYHVHFADETAFTDSYYARFRWDLSAGFGLRWPFEVLATSKINKVYGPGEPGNSIDYPANQLCSGIDTEGEAANRNAHLCAKEAEVKIQAVAPGDSHFNAAFYRATGLEDDKVFEGKEFVFELGMTCRFYASIPGPNIGEFYCPGGMVFEPFRDESQFSPQLGETRKDFLNFEIEGRLIGLALELGIGYVGFNPGVAIGGIDGEFSLDISGYRSEPGDNSVKFTEFNSDKIVNVAERASIINEHGGSGGSWGIDFSNPVYKVTSTLTPTMSVDVGVGVGPFGWEHKFGPFSVDELSVDIGSGEFERHEGTKNTYEMRNIGTRPIKPPEPK